MNIYFIIQVQALMDLEHMVIYQGIKTSKIVTKQKNTETTKDIVAQLISTKIPTDEVYSQFS